MPTRRLLAAWAALMLMGQVPHAAADEPCADDMKESVRGGEGCFGVDLVGKEGIRPGEPLVVFLHGDGGAMRNDRYRRGYRHQFSLMRDRGINAIAIARPHFSLPTGRTTGIWGNYGRDAYTPEVVDGLGAALKRLRAHYKPPG